MCWLCDSDDDGTEDEDEDEDDDDNHDDNDVSGCGQVLCINVETKFIKDALCL